MGQSGRHFLMCKALYEILRAAAGDAHTVSCDAFVYFDAANPERKLAPDGAVKLGVPQHTFDSWKTWERGAPELAFEILSPSDAPERWAFEEKLTRYRALGVIELVVFHADAEPGSRLRVWDRIDGDLVERAVTGERTPCLTLDAHLVVGPVDDLAACVRLAEDPEGRQPYPTEPEARAREADARKKAEADRAREADARKKAEADRAREADARKKAEADRAHEADARQEAEARLREAEERLAAIEAGRTR
ncbi:MAG: Uma2 family endonuclease [Labilithrix sp.]|nr:Uma2 family endonuclease [Labilithrix sp.]MBX3218164.1 Uma2 family endonuclease [Labilithrix sp.]